MSGHNRMKDIADELGVSITTVSRVINNKPDVSAETRNRILEAVERRQYGSRPLGSPNTGTTLIGFVNDFRRYPLSSSYVAGLLEGCQSSASDHAYSMTMIDSAIIQKEMRWPGRYEVFELLSGVIWSMPIFEESHRSFLESRGIPYVVVNNLHRGGHAPLVESDNHTAIRQGVEYLVGMGHTRIGFIGGALDIVNLEDRYKGYLQHLKEFGLEVNHDWIIDDLARPAMENGIEGTHRLVGRGTLPSAVVCANETIAIGAYQVFGELGIRIPEDISVLSFDDSVVSPLLNPPITTFLQHLDAMGERAVDVLTEFIHNPHHSAEVAPIRVPMTLIIRDSVKRLTSGAN